LSLRMPMFCGACGRRHLRSHRTGPSLEERTPVRHGLARHK
jgi:hypothetical protein